MTALYVTSTARLSQAMLLDLRLRVFRHTQRLSLEFHEKYTSGRIIARQTSDLEALRELLDSGVSSLASGMLFMVFTAVTVFALDWRSGLIVLAAGVPMFFLARWYQKHSQIAFRESRVVSARLIVHFVETMTGIRAVKAFRKERENASRYGELAEDYRKNTVRSINLNGIFQPGLVLIGNVCVAVVLLFGGFRVLAGTSPSASCWPSSCPPSASSSPWTRWPCSTTRSRAPRPRWKRCPAFLRKSPPSVRRRTLWR